MRIRALKAKRAELVAEAKAMFNLAEKENRSLTAAEVERDNAIGVELEANAAEIARLEAHAERIRNEPSSDAPAAPGVPAVHPAEPRVTVAAPNASKDPKKGFAHPREFLTTVMSASMGQRLDDRLKPLKTSAGPMQAAAGSDEHGEYSDPHGGFLVPEGFSPNLLRLDPEADPMSGRTRVIPMSNPILRIPARVDKNHSTSVSGGLTVSRRPETVAGASSRMEIERVSLEAHSLFGYAYATEEIMTDSPGTFAALLSAGFQDEFTAKIIDERINGTGTGQYLGVLNSPALVTVSKESGQAADTIKYENVIKMRSRCYGYSNAIWLANHDTLPQLATMSLAVGTGGSAVYMASAQQDRPDLLLGRPVFYTEYTKTLGDKGDLILFNGMEYLEGLLQPLNSAESIHVRFVEHERAFKFWLRNAGTPWWRSALTPKNSTSTLSPFVVLEAR